MSYNVIAIQRFRKELKKLAKKYPSLKSEYAELIDSLEKNPKQGDDLGKNCYKIRMSVASKGKGKSGGARIITHVRVLETTVYLLSIYDKSEQESIADKEILSILDDLSKE